MRIEGDIPPFRGGVCAASHSCHAVCDVGDETSMLKRKNVDSGLFFSQVGWDPPDGVTLRVCAPSHSCHAFCDVDDKTSMLKRKKVDFVLFFHR